MTATHIIPGFDDPTCGIAVAAKQLIARGVGESGEVWVHSMWTPMVIKASINVLLTGKKLVRMPHGCTDPTKLRHHWNKKRWVAPIERWLFRLADRIIATCEDEAAWIRAFEPNVKRIDIVSLNSVGMHEIGRKERKDRKDMEMRLLYVGRLHPLKGVEYLLEAMHALRNQQGSLRPLRSFRLTIIGKDEGEGRKLRQLASAYNLDVEFSGVVSEEEKESAYHWCDVLVLPTLSENFGLVVAEALERGKRVITTDGAPAWGNDLVGFTGFTGLYSGYDGRLIYLKGYRGGTAADRVRLLTAAIISLANSER